ncbi:MAG TPA: methionine--tRNA ligase subunit beta [Acidobacteriaceae bacterium]
MSKFYLTTPIYYVNARPHIGHAYTTIVADVLARRHRLLGDDTLFLTGTDEHGQKIERSAAVASISPQQLADDVSIQFRNLWDRMGLTYDRYIRTTDPKHKRGAQKLFAELYERGAIYLSSYTGQYSIGEEIFVEGPPGTIGPDGKPTETVTEENFFFRLSDYQLPLINLIESDTLLITPESRKNEVLGFLRGNVSSTGVAGTTGVAAGLSPRKTAPDEEGALAPGCVSEAAPTLAHSALGNPYVPGNLRDLSVSRSSFTWGIPVPEPAASATEKKHVMYVWLDALANYMTAVGYGSDAPEDVADFARYWPADLHIMAKEITRQHCVYWPAFLLAAGIPLPKAVTAHGWLLFDNSKMSKSKGNIVRTETILDGFGDHVYGKQFPDSTKPERDLFAADVMRYFLLREIPFGQDGSFSFDALITRYNADLANGYGNLVSRTANMIQQYFEGIVPAGLADTYGLESDFENETSGLIGVIRETQKTYEDFMADNDFAIALSAPFSKVAAVDRYISDHAPWKLAKQPDEQNRKKLAVILHTAINAIRSITVQLYPFIPYTAAKVWTQLGYIGLAASNGDLNNLQWGGLKPGTKLGPLAPIFPRADKGLVQIMTDMENPEAGSSKLEAENANPRPDAPLKSADTPTPAPPVTDDPMHPGAPPRTSAFEEPAAGSHVGGSAAITTERPPAPSHTEATPSGVFASVASQVPVTASDTAAAQQSPQITIDDFAKIELRVAEIKVAERIPKADKLLRLEVDLGYEKRQILSGIAEWYTPEELIGRRIVVITNLAPRKMRGLESHGMLLAASEGEGGKPVLATFGEEIALGSRLK